MSLVNLSSPSGLNQSTVQTNFNNAWKATTLSIPGLLAIYSIDYQRGHDGYRLVEHYDTYRLRLGGEERRYMSIKRVCTLGENNNTTLCQNKKCVLCRVFRNQNSLETYGDFGMGVYTTSHSSKATEDSTNANSSKVKAILQCKVIPGSSQPMSQKAPNTQQPGNGYQSIETTSAFTHPQTVFYTIDAVLPEYLIIVSDTAGPSTIIKPPPVKIPGLDQAEQDIEQVCQISNGSSQFGPFGSSAYKDSVRHFFESSAEVASSAVQPGNAAALGSIVQILGKYPKVPFAIKSGGHATSPGFSSTKGGIQIYLSRFDHIKYDPVSMTVEVGAGCLWDQVYLELAKHNRSAVGGARMGGVGVGGYLSGGGFSIKSNSHGLGIDNIVKMEVVLPDGKVVETYDNHPVYGDLFRALKGGGCNFGIITKFTLATYPQTKCWTSPETFVFGAADRTKIKQALVDFAQDENLPAEAVVVGTFRRYFQNQVLQSDIDVFCFYDGDLSLVNPDPFDDFRICKDPTRKKRSNDPTNCGFKEVSFVDAFKAFSDSKEQARGMSGVGEVERGRFACIMVKGYDKTLIDEMERQADLSAGQMTQHGGVRILIDVWPFRRSMVQHFKPSGWPHSYQNNTRFSHLLLYYTWEGLPNDPTFNDAFWINNMQNACTALKAAAGNLYDPSLPVYLNTTLGPPYTTTQQVYTQTHLAWLETMKKKYDPNEVMSRAGGFVIKRAP